MHNGGRSAVHACGAADQRVAGTSTAIPCGCICGDAVCSAMQARATSDVILLVISKFDYEDMIVSYPEQNDIIATNVLNIFDLDKDGLDITRGRGDIATGSVSDDVKERIRCGACHAARYRAAVRGVHDAGALLGAASNVLSTAGLHPARH